MDVCKKVYVCLCLHCFVWKSTDDIVQCLCTKDACFLVWDALNKSRGLQCVHKVTVRMRNILHTQDLEFGPLHSIWHKTKSDVFYHNLQDSVSNEVKPISESELSQILIPELANYQTPVLVLIQSQFQIDLLMQTGLLNFMQP